VTRAAAYLRISKDDEGTGLGVDRQYEAVKTLCGQRGWTLDPAWVIRENNKSAWDDSKPRPGFQRLLRGMESGQVEAVVVYAFDRLARRLRDTATVLELVEKKGVQVATVTGGLDLSSAYGRGIAGMLGSLAAMEMASMTERLKAKAEQSAQDGRVHNGGRRPYGYSLSRAEVVPEEAAVLREIAERLVAGSSLTGLARDLNQRGVTASTYTPKGPDDSPRERRWNTKTLREVMSRPRLCGRVVHRGEVVPGVVGKWPAILTEELFDQVQVAINARRRYEDSWTNRRVHLLSGTMLRCGTCGGKIHAFKQTSGVWAYRCRGHVSRNAQYVNDQVREEVLAYAAEHPLRVTEWEAEGQHELDRQIQMLQRRKDEAVAAFAAHGGDPAALALLTATLAKQIEALQDKQVAQFALSSGIEWASLDLTEVLQDGQDIDQQRAAIALYAERMALHPSKKRGRGYDPTALEITFRQPDRLLFRGVLLD